MVRCRDCGLVRSDPTADSSVVSSLYRESSLNYADQIPSLKVTYGACLDEVLRLGVSRGGLLEIGCGNGFFLDVALERGFRYVRGVEPSVQAVESASESTRSLIVADLMRPGLFPRSRFDVVCMFQVLDHLTDPRAIVSECFEVLSPGGFVLCVNHNFEAFSARLMRERSPIVDVEHTYLYSPATMRALFSSCGFETRVATAAVNSTRFGHLARMLPVGAAIRGPFLNLLEKSRAASIPLRLPIGNLLFIAQKPAA
jgi:SAM-dependent methyltransferase